jgi:hypothetical protein
LLANADERKRLALVLYVEHQRVGLGTRTANHNELVRFFLLFAKDHIAMIRNSRHDRRLTGAANPLGAGIGHVETAIQQSLKDRLARADFEGLTGPLKNYRERSFFFDLLFIGKPFEMNARSGE